VAGFENGDGRHFCRQSAFEEGFTALYGSCENDDVRTLQRGEGFPKRAPGEEVPVSQGMMAVQENDVEIPPERSMLKTVVENHDIGTKAAEGVFPGHGPTGPREDRNGRKSPGDEKRFVPPFIRS
jgi:hypothetical protein